MVVRHIPLGPPAEVTCGPSHSILGHTGSFKDDVQDLPLPDSPEVPGMHSCSAHKQAPQQLVSNTS